MSRLKHPPSLSTSSCLQILDIVVKKQQATGEKGGGMRKALQRSGILDNLTMYPFFS